MNCYNYPNIVPAGTVMNATINSLAMQLEDMFGFMIQATWSGTPTGSFSLQISADPVPKNNFKIGANGVVTYTPVYWNTVTSSTYAVTTAGAYYWDYPVTASNYVRLVYTDTSGGTSTATITAVNFNGKGQA